MIGVFDSGFGGLVVLREVLPVLPDYDYLYLGDNARIPYGRRAVRAGMRFPRPAGDRPRMKRIGVIATEGTVISQSFELELKKLDPEVEVVQQACPLLVPIIESGEQEWEGTTLILRRYLAPFKGRVDTLILGCTHYSILKDQIRAILGGGHDLICSGQVTAATLVA